jgi:hypothetical protein
MLRDFEALVARRDAPAEDVLKSFFRVTGDTEEEEKRLKRNLGQWRKVTKKAFQLLKQHRPELALFFTKKNVDHPMRNVQASAA